MSPLWHKVSLHAPVWVRPRRRSDRVLITAFQFTHPCGCDHCHHPHPLHHRGFNSRTRVGATDGKIDSLLTSLVSIHAPVWVRHYTMALRETFNGFNSRTRVGATCKNHDKVHNDDVSIHAPVWVRQVRDQTTTQSKTVSIHAPVWVRLESYRARQSSLKFQFTHPCGCDNPARTPRPRRPSFNSRTRVGATVTARIYETQTGVSIHAPVWVRQPDEYGLSIKHATKVLRQPDARTRCGQA